MELVRRCAMHRRLFSTLVIAAVVGLVAIGCGREAAVDETVVGAAGGSATSMTLEVTTTENKPVATSENPVFDFPAADDVKVWSVVNDTVMGGVSTGQLTWENSALVFTGDLSLDNNGGFASVRSPLIDPTATMRWADNIEMIVEVRGDGRTWAVEVRMEGDDGGWISSITTSAEEVTAVALPWATFEPVTRFLDPRSSAVPLEPARIVSVAFYLVDGVEAPFRLELRSIS